MAAQATPTQTETFESALKAHQGVFSAAKQNFAELPEKRGGLPLTFTEATAYIQHKEDEKRRREAKKDRQKQRAGPPMADVISGLIPGPPETSPFWLVMEGFFRDVTREDVAALLPTLADPLEDPIYLIPPIGRHYSAHDASEAGVHTPSSLQRSSRPPAHVTLLKDRVSELKAQAAAEAAPARDAEAGAPGDAAANAALDDTQRKSRRLVAKAEKQAVARQYKDGDLFGGDGQLGTGPGCLLQSCSADEVSLLTSQALALLGDSIASAIQDAGCQPEQAEELPAAQDSPAGGAEPLTGRLCKALRAWLRQEGVHILGRRTTLCSTEGSQQEEEQPAAETVMETCKLEEDSAPVHEAPPAQQEDMGREDSPDQASQPPQQAAAAEALRSDGQPAAKLTQTDKAAALDAPDGGGAQAEQDAGDMSATLQQASKAKAVKAADEPAAPQPESMPDVTGEQFEPSPGAALLQDAGMTLPEPMQIDHGAAQGQPLPDAKPDLAHLVASDGVPEASADAGAASQAAASRQPLITQETASQQVLDSQAEAAAPASSAPATVAVRPGRPWAAGLDTRAAFSCLPCSVTSMAPDQAAKLTSWAAWQDALRAAPAAAQASAADDESMHPYTRRLLANRASQYVLQPERHDDSRAGGMAFSGIITPTGVTPSVSGDDSSALTGSHPERTDGDVQSAHTPRQHYAFTALPSHLSTGGESAAAFDTPAQGTPDGQPEGPSPGNGQLKIEPAADLHGDAAHVAERVASGSLAGPLHSHGAKEERAVHIGAPSGGKRAPGEHSGKAGKRGGSKGGTDRGEARQRGQTALAVQSAIAAGAHEGGLEDQWAQLAAAAGDLAAAPDDEILAETLAVQAELLQQVAVNRSRLKAVVEALLRDMPHQRKAAARREEGIEFARQFHNRLKALKRGQKRERREAAARDALKEAQAAMPTSPRQAASRLRADRSITPTRAWQGEMVDMLASRRGEEEALCAVCAEGHSVDANVIVFCERCDLAVHQLCYGIEHIPSGEWLCWPCRVHEEALRAGGVPQKDIRPPRWELAASADGRRQLEGGSLTAECALCPIRHGAFRQTVDTHEWVHQVCALWTPDVRLRRGPALDVVEGVSGLAPERWGVPCSICSSAAGAALRCSAGHCTLPFHALCARNAGLHLAARGEAGQKTQYRAYCALHSEPQRRKDFELAAEGGALKRRDGKRVAKEEAAAQAALRGLAGREAHWDTLERARLELESLRMLLERIGRREKVKRQLVLATWEAMKLRAGNPLPGWQACLEAEALLPIGARLAARQGQALGGAPAQAAQQPGPASAFSKPAQAPAFGHASLAPKTLPGRHMPMSPKQGTGSLLHLPSIAAEGLPGSGSGSGQAPAEALLVEPAGVPLAFHQQRALLDAGQTPDKLPGSALAREDTQKADEGASAAAEQEAIKGPDTVDEPLGKRKRDSGNADTQKGKRAKKGESKPMEIEEAAGLPSGSPSTRSRSLRSSDDQVDKKCLMTSSEAAAANSRMPKGFKYMPVQPARKSSRPGSSKGGRT